MSKKLFNQCLILAKTNIHRCTETNNHFSFIIQQNEILAWGYNRRGQVHKKFGYRWYSNIHSEVDAYAKGMNKIDKKFPWMIINIRLNNQLETMLSSPCECCNQYLSLLNCSKVVYSVENNQFKKIKL